MNVKLRPVFASLCMLGLCSIHTGFAATKRDQQSQQIADDMHKIASQTQKIEKQMVELQQEMNELREEQQILQKRQDNLEGRRKSSSTKSVSHAPIQQPHSKPSSAQSSHPLPPALHAGNDVGQENYTRASQHVPRQFEHHPEKAKPKYDIDTYNSKYYRENESPFYQADPEDLPYSGMHDLAKLGGTAVITSPFIHSTYTYDGSDLIVNYSSIKKYEAALEQRKAFVNEMASLGLRPPKMPMLEISGELEAQAFGQTDFNDDHDRDINLTMAEVDFQALINKWITGFIALDYDDTPLSQGGQRIANSNAYVDTAFITLGNFNRSPFYASFGQNYVPFGSFNSNMVSDPLSKILFRTKSRALIFGYKSQQTTGLDMSGYAAQGDARTGTYQPMSTSRSHANSLNLFGGDIQYTALLWGALHATVGASYINNIADSNGMQLTGGSSSTFEGIGRNSATEVLQHRVPGVDLRTDFNYGPFNLVGEYDTATTSFSPRDISFNGHGANVKAFHVEGDYSFDFFTKPSNIGLSAGATKEALAFNVPAQRYMLTFNTSIWESTICSLEYRHDVNYSSKDTASGTNGGPIFATPGGHTSNAITGQIDVYF